MFPRPKHALLGRFLKEVLPPWKKWVRSEDQTDELTRVFNLKAANALIPQWVGRARSNFYLGFADLDYFKSINDCHSHDMGDFVLVAFAGLASRVFPDHVFRVGGEEFIWCSEGTQKDVLARAEVFRRTVELELAPAANRLLEGHFVYGQDLKPASVRYAVTVSQGVAQAGGKARTFHELKASADAALYLAKDAGRNAVVFRSKLVSRGETPIHYTRSLVKVLHQKARQKGFACWWEMCRRLDQKELQKMIRLGWKNTEKGGVGKRQTL